MKKSPATLDLDAFAVDVPFPRARGQTVRRKVGAPPRPRKGECYFGPVPMSWVERAAALPGRAWHLACALWFEASCSGKAVVRLPGNTRRRFGLRSGHTLRRAAEALRGKGLIAVEDRPGRLALYTLQAVRTREATA
jgi:hypothetical protein